MKSTLNPPRHSQGPQVLLAHMEADTLRLELASGSTLSIPVRQLRPLASLGEEQLADVRLVSGGTVLLWPAGAASIAVEGLLEAVTGLHTLKAAQRKGGRARSETKAIAVRANGAKGGRPRKVPGAAVRP